MKIISSILLVVVLFSGCGTTEKETSDNIDSINAAQEKMIREGSATTNQNQEENYNVIIAKYLDEAEGPTGDIE